MASIKLNAKINFSHNEKPDRPHGVPNEIESVTVPYLPDTLLYPTHAPIKLASTAEK